MHSLSKAEHSADEIEVLVQKGLRKNNIKFSSQLRGMVELERNNYSKAIEFLKKARDMLYAPNDVFPEYTTFFTFSLAQAYYEAENLEKAQEEFEKVTSLTLARFQNGDIYARSLFTLGKIFENKGQKKKAVEYYEKFLTLWKDADADILEVEDARKRLAHLTSLD